MTTSPTQFLSEILSGEKIPANKVGYFRARFSNRMHELILSTFLDLERKKQITQADIARRIDKDRALVSRWLGSPGNWTLDTVSDLMLAMGFEPAMEKTDLRTFLQKVDNESGQLPPSPKKNRIPGMPAANEAEDEMDRGPLGPRTPRVNQGASAAA